MTAKTGHQDVGPTPSEIDERRRKIRDGWTAEQERNRRTGTSAVTPYEMFPVESLPCFKDEEYQEPIDQ